MAQGRAPTVRGDGFDKEYRSGLGDRVCANDETGKICPAQTTLAEYLNLSVATIKRGIRELVALGWLDRTEGRGAGDFTRDQLKSPCKIIPFRRRKKGSQPSLQAQEKGSPVTEKGIMAEPSYKEQSFEQKSAGGADRRDGKPSAPPRGPASPERLVFVPGGSASSENGTTGLKPRGWHLWSDACLSFALAHIWGSGCQIAGQRRQVRKLGASRWQ